MARPAKKTVDYFPHKTVHGKTMFILENRWGNDGYAFWFKLLETLGTKDGLFLDCNDPAEWEFLLAKTHVNDIIANEILETLSKVGAIDAELWAKKIIYCQNFVDGVADAFRRRTEFLPDKNFVFDSINGVNDSKQSSETGKGKGKGKGKGNNGDFYLPDWIPSEQWENFDSMRRSINGKYPWTLHAKKLAVTELEKLKNAGNDPIDVLNQSVLNGWRGLFKVDKPKQPSSYKPAPDLMS